MGLQRGIKKKNSTNDIAPDEIFLDSTNIPDFNQSQFEGRIEKPIGRWITIASALLFICVGLLFILRLWNLQIKHGEAFAARSENNSLRHTLVFSDRGVIFDRNNILLAWNVENPSGNDFSLRQYATTSGISNLIGYIKYPSKDTAGFYYREDYIGVDGVEKFYNDKLQGENGLKITETSAQGKVESQGVLAPPINGENINLSIDARIQSEMYNAIRDFSAERGFTGGAGVIMDVKTGEIIAEVTYPEYDSQTMAEGTNTSRISGYLADKNNPLLDRATSGLYTPGSILKPIMALAALNEGVITPDKILYTTGSISIQNPYNPDITYVYNDWKNHGPVDMRTAIAQSSDVYFYEVGGGYKDQRGIGIANIDKYARMFGYGEPVGSDFFGTKVGTIPSPEWKAANFNGENWTVGDTYHTVIGQYGFQVTPLQVARAVSALANGGSLLRPTILLDDKSYLKDAQMIDLPKQYFDVVHEGMRETVMSGIAQVLNVDYVDIAAKTGTAELGVSKQLVNSWTTGFFPYKNPRYAFVFLTEKGPHANTVGASAIARKVFDWMSINTPEYFSTTSL